MNTTHTTPLPASGGHEDDDDNSTTAPPAGGHPGNDQVGFGQVGNPAQTASSAQFGSSFDTASFGSASTSFGAGPQARPDHPLDTPLPYGSGFSTTQPLGYRTGPMDLGVASYGSAGGAANGAVEVADRKKSGSPGPGRRGHPLDGGGRVGDPRRAGDHADRAARHRAGVHGDRGAGDGGPPLTSP